MSIYTQSQGNSNTQPFPYQNMLKAMADSKINYATLLEYAKCRVIFYKQS